jgi:hypothetical protein
MDLLSRAVSNWSVFVHTGSGADDGTTALPMQLHSFQTTTLSSQHYTSTMALSSSSGTCNADLNEILKVAGRYLLAFCSSSSFLSVVSYPSGFLESVCFTNGNSSTSSTGLNVRLQLYLNSDNGSLGMVATLVQYVEDSTLFEPRLFSLALYDSSSPTLRLFSFELLSAQVILFSEFRILRLRNVHRLSQCRLCATMFLADSYKLAVQQRFRLSDPNFANICREAHGCCPLSRIF